MFFGILTALLLVIDGATGGKIKQPGGEVHYGNWNPNALFPIYCVSLHLCKAIRDSLD